MTSCLASSAEDFSVDLPEEIALKSVFLVVVFSGFSTSHWSHCQEKRHDETVSVGKTIRSACAQSL